MFRFFFSQGVEKLRRGSLSELELQVQLEATGWLGSDGTAKERRGNHAHVSDVIGVVQHIERVD